MAQTYTIEDLRKMQARPPERKVLITYTRLLELCMKVNYKIAVSFSGGKDSTVLLDMVARFWASDKESHGNAPLVVVFANTSNEFAGMENFVKFYCKYIEDKHGITIDLHIVRGEKTFYLEYYKLPYFKRYGDLLRDEKTGLLYLTGEQRTGCKLCLFGCQFKDRGEQFTRLAETEPQTVEFAMRPKEEKGLGYKEVLDYINQNCKCKIKIPEEPKNDERK